MPGNRHKRRGQQFWEDHISRWDQSELTQAEYCQLNKIAIKNFQYWRTKAKRANTPTLVELPLAKIFPTLPACHPQLCLVINQQYRIEIGKGFDPEDLERLLRLLVRM